jgi:hypothetical protein
MLVSYHNLSQRSKDENVLTNPFQEKERKLLNFVREHKALNVNHFNF